MNWQATIVQYIPNSGRFDCVIFYQDLDSGDAKKEPLTGSNLDQIKDLIRDRIAALSSGGPADEKEIASVLNQPLDLSASTPDPPDPAFVSFQADVRTLARMKRAVDIGAMAQDDSAFTTLAASVTSALAKNPTWIDAF